jgi:predicted enzyme related to lactoylglutathione lyase
MTTHDGPWPDGYPCWVDLNSSDREAAWAFYSSVMGWKVVDSGDDGGLYGIAMSGDVAVAAIGQAPSGAPTTWTTYFASSDADATAQAVESAGGELILPPGDVGPMGRMALAIDSTGAPFGIWQAGTHPGAGMVRLPGSMSWHDLMTRDTLAAKDFYAAVFGWEFTVMDPVGDYSTVPGDSPWGMICAVGAISTGVPEQVPAHWRVYFSVTGTDQAVERVRQGGGSLLSGPWDTPYGRMSEVCDPQGATFVLIDHSTAQMPA